MNGNAAPKPYKTRSDGSDRTAQSPRPPGASGDAIGGAGRARRHQGKRRRRRPLAKGIGVARRARTVTDPAGAHEPGAPRNLLSRRLPGVVLTRRTATWPWKSAWIGREGMVGIPLVLGHNVRRFAPGAKGPGRPCGWRRRTSASNSTQPVAAKSCTATPIH